jgi:hypothetical protein
MDTDLDLERALQASEQKVEQEAARKLRVRPIDLAVAAFGLWGRSLTEERDRRASGTSRQAKGHVTRRLLAELADKLKEE